MVASDYMPISLTHWLAAPLLIEVLSPPEALAVGLGILSHLPPSAPQDKKEKRQPNQVKKQSMCFRSF